MESISPTEMTEILARALVERYGDDALAIAHEQAKCADTLSEKTWTRIVRLLAPTD